MACLCTARDPRAAIRSFMVLTRIHLPLTVAACALSVQQQTDLARGRMASGSPMEHRVTRAYIPHIHTFDPPERLPTATA